ncbi:MAG TPA: glycosyltransferase family 4 protein [Steroidobacteraceae bacterium]|nr:glycosyltransferase family 4 protein [Steroidobacteraceae bacterium]
MSLAAAELATEVLHNRKPLEGRRGAPARRTVVLAASYAPSLWTFRRHLIEELGRRGYRVLACAPQNDEASRNLAALGAEFMVLGPGRTSRNPFDDLRYFWKLLRLCRRLRPDALIGYTAKPVIWGSLAGRMAGVENVVAMITGLGFAFTENGSAHSWVSVLVGRLYRIALRRCNSVVFQNPDDQEEFVRRRLIRRGSRTFVVKGSGVDLHEFRPAILPDSPIFLLVARVLRDKGIREFCEAAMRVKSRYPESSFRLVGWFDPENPRAVSPVELESWCANGVVEYRGPVEDVRVEMAQCRVYVLPSYREGTPRTVLEAMAMGRPIITTDAPGCRETVRHGWNGYLVPVRDSSALASAMESFIAEPRLVEKMGANSRQLVESAYDGRRVAQTIVDGAEL